MPSAGRVDGRAKGEELVDEVFVAVVGGGGEGGGTGGGGGGGGGVGVGAGGEELAGGGFLVVCSEGLVEECEEGGAVLGVAVFEVGVVLEEEGDDGVVGDCGCEVEGAAAGGG